MTTKDERQIASRNYYSMGKEKKKVCVCVCVWGG